MNYDLHSLSPAERASAIKAMGLSLGFSDVGIAGAGPYPEMDRFKEWLASDYHGEMGYMYRHRRRRADPQRTLKDLKSVIVAALDYDTPHPRSTEVDTDPERGWISRYAWGDDYHDVIEEKLDRWKAELLARAPGHAFRHYVDHGPVLEKVFARYAGLGWMGKHTNIIHPRRGSFFFLAVILTDLEIEPGEPIADLCGSCTACLDACPTSAFPEPYVLDSRRCLSYLTIEIKGDVPEEFHDQIGQQVFGCDICQDVCPWNRKPIPPNLPAFQPREQNLMPNLEELIKMSDDTFNMRFRGSPLQRRGIDGVKHTAKLVRAARQNKDGDE